MDRRYALNAERLRKSRVLVDIDLGKDPLAVGLVGKAFEDRSKGPAWPAPRRPEVDNDGCLERPVDDLCLKSCFAYVDLHL